MPQQQQQQQQQHAEYKEERAGVQFIFISTFLERCRYHGDTIYTLRVGNNNIYI